MGIKHERGVVSEEIEVRLGVVRAKCLDQCASGSGYLADWVVTHQTDLSESTLGEELMGL